MRKILMGAVAGLFALSALSAQDYKPSCNMCPGTYVPNSEVQAYVKRAIANNLIDQQIRAVDIGKVNLDFGVVYRGKIAKPSDAAEHDLVSELYHVIEGSGTLMLGPEIVGAKRRPADNEAVRLLNGPGNGADSIRNGVSYDLKAGDVVIIPAGTGHQFMKIDDHITYLMVRVDPDKVTPHKDAAASKAYLATPPASGRRNRGRVISFQKRCHAVRV